MGNAVDAAASTHVATMGPRLGALFYTLWQHTARLSQAWEEYRLLFAHSKERIDFLNRAAPEFFLSVQNVFYEDVLLNITRLTGPVVTGKGPKAQDNVTIRALPALIADAALQTSAKAAVDEAVLASEFAVPARNKWIAHLDAKTLLDPSAPEVNLGSRAKVGAALEKIAAALNVVQQYYEGTTTMFHVMKPIGGVEQLLYVLEQGVKAEESRLAKLQAGVLPPV